jgi:hypothetical protein
MNKQELTAIINGWNEANPQLEQMTLEQRLIVEQAKMLRAINSKLNFFVFLIVIQIIVSFLFS